MGRGVATPQLTDRWLPPVAAFAASWLLLAVRSGGSAWLSPETWTRWDSGHYLGIARRGYVLSFQHTPHACIPPRTPPGEYACGNTAWFPGYPFLSRAVHEVTFLPLDVAAMLVSWGCWLLALVLIWRLCSEAASRSGRLGVMALAAAAPGVPYFAGLFPLSLAAAGVLGAIYLAFVHPARWAPWAAAGCAAIAAASYPTVVAAVPAFLAGAFLASGAARRGALLAGAGAAGGFAAVLLLMHAWVGRWDAPFLMQEKYTRGTQMPVVALARQVSRIWTTEASDLQRAVGAQALLVAVLLAAAIVLVVKAVPPVAGSLLSRARASLDPADLTLVLAAGAMWCAAYAAGEGVSSWRSEALAVVCLPVLRRLPVRALAVPIGCAVLVAWAIAHYYFTRELI